ncbi:hypothetical protein ANCCAN_15584 [Ancylostoma caninum]|uniref:Uncharacterized protein n=1 Tax=Ancylostoma caninum TaxID=29170 RepID=A0A368G5D5_ANCCA|nr:hypothetical protein ANCCAN_15584 [Ancylostoma caninum]
MLASPVVESVRQLIETTRKNRRLTKQNEKFLNESAAWYEEKSFLEKQFNGVFQQIKDKDAAAESLLGELREKDDKIAVLEKRVADLLRSISEHPAEEASEAAVELILDKKVTFDFANCNGLGLYMLYWSVHGYKA